MKKTISIILAMFMLVALSSCKGNEDYGKALETANTVFNVSGGAGSITIDENVARTLLGAYPQKVTGLKEAFDSYEFRLSATRIFNQDACMVEVFSAGQEVSEKTFAILGIKCYVYDSGLKKYLLMTSTGVVEVEEAESQAGASGESTTQGFVYNEDNNDKLQKRFSAYSEKSLGLEKSVEEYILVATGTTTTASDGSLVFVIRLYEKTGTATNVTLAFNESNNYRFDVEEGKYVKL